MNNPEVPAEERLFMLLASIALTGLAATILTGVVIGENLESQIASISAFLVFLVMAWAGYRFNKINVMSIIVAVILIFIFQPLNFFTSGAVHGGAVMWDLFYTTYICMILRGRIRFIFLGIEVVLTCIMFYLYFTFPGLTIRHSEETAAMDSIGSFFLVGAITVVMICFQTWLYKSENKRSELQKNEINDLNQAQNRFFSSMSHEIRTPINTIIGLNEMILREESLDEIHEDAETIQASSNMLLSLINDILDMSKMQSGQMQLTSMEYNAAEMINDVVGMIWVRAREKGLGFTADVSPDLPEMMYGDEVRIRQILINVLNNAVKYTNEGEVSITINQEVIENDRINVVYTITDTGIGIRKESIPYLFDAFRRVDEDRNRMIEGTGLGLSIVKQLVDLMDGKITVNSVYMKGSTFVIEIPQRRVGGRRIGEMDSNQRQRIRSRDAYHVSFKAPEAYVLAVDDTPANLTVVTKLLRETGIHVETAKSGEEALEMTLEKAYHVILMDHLMPEMDGIECFHRIRTQAGGMCREARVVALTANAGSDRSALYTREGFDGYLVKPVSGRALENEIRRLLPRKLVTVTDERKDLEERSSLWRDIHEMRSVVTVTTDSTSDIPSDLIKKYDIRVIPVRIETEYGYFRDGVDINTQGVLEYMEDREKKIRFRPIDIRRYENFFADCLKESRNVIHISGSADVMASSWPYAEEASRTFDNVFIIDSKQVSCGLGLLTLDACRLAHKESNPDEIVSMLEKKREKIESTFIIDNLDYMNRTRLINSRLRDVTKAFLMRPVIHMSDGKMKVIRHHIGVRKSAWKKYIRHSLRHANRIDREIILVPYVGLLPRDMEWIKDEIKERVPFKEIRFQEASSTVAANCGPGTFGLMFRRK